jgi:hypothetical protein
MNKRVFGWSEVVFDILYLLIALAIGVYILSRATQPSQVLAGIMALVLAGGDAFHLVPRIIAAAEAGAERRLNKALGFGKFITSITMTVFYMLLWHIGILLYAPAGAPYYTAVAYALAAVRIGLCLSKQNRWSDEDPPLGFAVYRNIPFVLLGTMVTVLFGVHAQNVPAFRFMWLAIVLSFAFYMPVVLFANKNRKLGMLMLPKTLAYLWMLLMCLGALR